MVKIHGNWCGPNWTGGQRVSAQDYQGSWQAPCQDPLDCACRSHDLDGSHPKGNSRKGDTALIQSARKRVLSDIDNLKLQAKYTTLILRGKYRSAEAKRIRDRLAESDAASLVITGISIARPFRRR